VPAICAHIFLDFADGGAQRLTLASWRHLDPRRFEPVLVGLRGNGSLIPAARGQGVPVHLLGRLQHPFDLASLAPLTRLLRRLRPAVVVTPLYSRASPYARFAARLAGVPLVVAHEYGRGEDPPLLRRVVDRLLAPATHFLAASEAQRLELQARGVATGAIAVSYDGIEVARFAGGDREGARRHLGIPAGRPVALVPARLHPMKGHADLLAAVPELRRRVPEALVLCAGAGPLEAELHRLAAAAGLAGAIRFLGHREDIPELLAAADLVLLPSRREGLPAALLEAWAARRPVVATAVGGVPEALTDGREGRLVPAGAPAALAAAAADLLLDPGLRDAMAARGAATVASRFEVAATTLRRQAILERWLREAGPASRRAHGRAHLTLPPARPRPRASAATRPGARS
jgi:L-malate glycosyltransferase